MCVWECSLELSELMPEDTIPDKKRRKDEEEDDLDLSKGEEAADTLQQGQQWFL